MSGAITGATLVSFLNMFAIVFIMALVLAMLVLFVCHLGVDIRWPELSKPFWLPGAPCKSTMTLRSLLPAQVMAFFR